MSDFTKLKVKKNGKEYTLNACTQDTEQNITGTKNFTKLTVNSKNVVTSINGVDADARGNVTIDVAAGGTVSLKSTRTSEGSWTITGLEVGKPLYVISSSLSDPAYDSYRYHEIRAVSGTLDNSNTASRIGSIASSASAGSGLTNVFIVIPTSTTVVLSNGHRYADNYLRAYQ